MAAWKVIVLTALFLIPLAVGVWLWAHYKMRLGVLPVVLLAALVVGALLAGGYIIFDMWLVARNQGHF